MSEYASQIEVLNGLQDVVETNLSKLLPAAEAWQPTDFLPDLGKDDWMADLQRFRDSSANLSDELLVVLSGNMITEEALPSYAISLNMIAKDGLGDSPTPWARWMRGWIAEENRHGDLLNAYLRLTGRVDMRSIERTIHYLLTNGFNSRSFPDHYAGLIYTSFQERATTVSHANTGRIAARMGDENLSKICKKIAADESRHEQFYTAIMREVMDRDPEAAILVFRQMMKRTIAMPGRHMYDGREPDLFEKYATVAQKTGVYTLADYAGIIGYLVNAWKVGSRSVTGRAAKAQEFLCVQAERLGNLNEDVMKDVFSRPTAGFSWIHGRPA